MAAVTTKTFRSGNNEVLRSPKDIGFGAGTEVEIVRAGNTVTIRPVRKTMAWLVERLNELPPLAKAWTREPFAPPESEGVEKDWRFYCLGSSIRALSSILAKAISTLFDKSKRLRPLLPYRL